METNEVSSKKDWTFNRVLRVSSKFAVLYVLLSLIPALVFKSNFDIVFNKDTTLFFFSKAVTIHNFGLCLILNTFGIFLFVAVFLGWLSMFNGEGLGDSLCNSVKEKDKPWINTINLIYSGGFLLWVGSTFIFMVSNGSSLGLGMALLLGSIYGSFFFFFCVLIGVLIWVIKVLTSKEFWVMIGRGILSGVVFFWKFLIR